MPVSSPIQSYLETLHARYRDLTEGAVANYIPELARVDPDRFGISLATTDGFVYETGDSRWGFTIQSISKALTYGLALGDRGVDAVLSRIGVEPSGDAFNSISLKPGTGQPLNPMINAGAIAATGLVAGHSEADRWHRILAVYSLYAGRALAMDEAVYASESATGHRNRAIAHMLRNFGMLDGDPELSLDLYFRQCSIEVTCRDLSVMAATLANGGVNPLTRERAVDAELVQRILSVMTTCGMYDQAGEWAYWVGLPAKSGVGGGLMVVMPGQLGIGVYSPRLDEYGNSIRGLRVCRDLSRDCELHFLKVARSPRGVIRSQGSLRSRASRRIRNDHEQQGLRREGERVAVLELQGDMHFPEAEAVARTLAGKGAELALAVLDLRRVSLIAETAARVLLDCLTQLRAGGGDLAFAGRLRHGRFFRFLQEQLAPTGSQIIASFDDLDGALEWAETWLVRHHGSNGDGSRSVELGAHEFCKGLTGAALARLDAMLERRRFERGKPILNAGDPADGIYLLLEGVVSILVPTASGQPRRVATLSPGMTFGELAALDGATRSADVRADSTVTCAVLDRQTLDRLDRVDPDLKIALLANMLRIAHRTVGRLSEELAGRDS